MLIFTVKMGLIWGSWGPLGAQDEAKMGPSCAKLGPSWGQVAIWRRLGAILEATWPNMANKMATRWQLEANMLKNGTPLERNGART